MALPASRPPARPGLPDSVTESGAPRGRRPASWDSALGPQSAGAAEPGAAQRSPEHRRSLLAWLLAAAALSCGPTGPNVPTFQRSNVPTPTVLPHPELGLVQALRGAALTTEYEVRHRLLRQFARAVVHGYDFRMPVGRSPAGGSAAPSPGAPAEVQVRRSERLAELETMAVVRASAEQWAVVEIPSDWSPGTYGSAIADVVRRARPHKLLAGNEVDIRSGPGVTFDVDGDAPIRASVYLDFYMAAAAAAAAVPGVEVLPAGLASASSQDSRDFLQSLLIELKRRRLPPPSVLPFHFHEQPIELPRAAAWLRQQLDRYGYTGTEPTVTELGDPRAVVLGVEMDPRTHAYGVAALMATSYGLGVRALVFGANSFTTLVPRVSYPGLLDLRGRPRPAYRAFAMLQDLLPPGAIRRLQLQARPGLARLDVRRPDGIDVTVWFAPVDPATIADGHRLPRSSAVAVPPGAAAFDPLGQPLRLRPGRLPTVQVATTFGQPGSVAVIVQPAAGATSLLGRG